MEMAHKNGFLTGNFGMPRQRERASNLCAMPGLRRIQVSQGLLTPHSSSQETYHSVQQYLPGLAPWECDTPEAQANRMKSLDVIFAHSYGVGDFQGTEKHYLFIGCGGDVTTYAVANVGELTWAECRDAREELLQEFVSGNSFTVRKIVSSALIRGFLLAEPFASIREIIAYPYFSRNLKEYLMIQSWLHTVVKPKTFNPEEMLRCFESFHDEQTFTLDQLEVLNACVHLVSDVTRLNCHKVNRKEVENNVGLPDTVEGHKADIEDVGGSPANVNVVNEDTLADKVGKSVVKYLTLHDTQHGVGNGILPPAKDSTLPVAGDETSTKKLLTTLRRGEEIDLNAVIGALFEQRPETRAFSSRRLLLYLKDIARKQGVEITVGDSRIRQLKVWRENAAHRRSGKTQCRGEMGDATDEDAVDVNDPDYDVDDNAGGYWNGDDDKIV